MKSLKNNPLLFSLFVLFLSVTAPIRILAQSHSCFSLLSSSSAHVVLRFDGENFHFKSQQGIQGSSRMIITKDGVSGLDKNAPNLPQYAVSLRLPRGTKMVVKVLSTRFYDMKRVVIAPSRGNVYRNVQRDSLPLVFGKVYEKDAFYPVRLWNLRAPYLLRENQGQTLVLHPFRYNPVKKILRVYTEVILDITFQQNAGKGSHHFSFQKPFNQVGFKNILSRHFLNDYTFEKSTQKQPFSPPSMLIVSYGPFIPLLKKFINWKQKTGVSVDIVDVDAIGKNARDIKAYIRDVYRKKGITYVLLVGDAGQVPSGTIGGNDSDNDYAYVDGNDHYPDLFVGRFPAENSSQLGVMIDRTLAYEQETFSSDTLWYTSAIGIGSEMGEGYHKLKDFQQIRWIDSAYLLESTYHRVTELFDGSQGGADAAGNPTSAMLSAAINKGAGIINYCGHGTTTGWNTTHFTSDKISLLENEKQWPFIFSVSCATGNFVHQDCFAEQWLRAVHNGKPVGAVAVLMPTIDQSWSPPMCGQQQMNALVVAPDSVHPPRTFAAICMDGCIKMNDEFGTAGYETTDTWTVFGDPSLEIRTAAPKKITADFPAFVEDTCTSVLVKTNLHSGRVALFSRGVIYAVAPVDAFGNAGLSVDSLSDGQPVDLTITSFNHIPFFGKIVKESVSRMKENRENIFQFKVFPNPSGGKILISFVLKRSRQTEVTVFDMRGKEVAVLCSGNLSSGEHRLHWQTQKPGTYIVRLKTATHFVEKKVVILN